MALENRIQEISEELALEKQRVSRLASEIELLQSDRDLARQERELMKLEEKKNRKQVQKMRVFYGFLIGVIAFNFRGRQAPQKPDTKRVLPGNPLRQIPSFLTMKQAG